ISGIISSLRHKPTGLLITLDFPNRFLSIAIDPRRNCSEYGGEVESSHLGEWSARARAENKGGPLGTESYLPDGRGVVHVGRMRRNAAPEGCAAPCSGCVQRFELAGHDFGQAGRLHS